MNDGALDQRVTIQQQSATQDATGQQALTWTNFVTAGDGNVWASVKHTSGLQSIKSGADVSIIKASIRIRYRAGINAGMRVVHGSTIYDIKAALPKNRQWLDLVCEATS